MPNPPEFSPETTFNPEDVKDILKRVHARMDCPSCKILATELTGAKTKIARLQRILTPKQVPQVSPTVRAAAKWAEENERIEAERAKK